MIVNIVNEDGNISRVDMRYQFMKCKCCGKEDKPVRFGIEYDEYLEDENKCYIYCPNCEDKFVEERTDKNKDMLDDIPDHNNVDIRNYIFCWKCHKKIMDTQIKPTYDYSWVWDDKTTKALFGKITTRVYRNECVCPHCSITLEIKSENKAITEFLGSGE